MEIVRANRSDSMGLIHARQVFDRLGRSVRRIEQLVILVDQESQRRVKELRVAVADRDCRLAQRAAHTLKSHAAMFGAESVRELAHRVERLAKRQDLTGVCQCLNELESRVGQLVRELKRIDWSQLV